MFAVHPSTLKCENNTNLQTISCFDSNRAVTITVPVSKPKPDQRYFFVCKHEVLKAFTAVLQAHFEKMQIQLYVYPTCNSFCPHRLLVKKYYNFSKKHCLILTFRLGKISGGDKTKKIQKKILAESSNSTYATREIGLDWWSTKNNEQRMFVKVLNEEIKRNLIVAPGKSYKSSPGKILPTTSTSLTSSEFA